MQKLNEVGWWAAYAGINDEGTFTCAMVTSTPDGREGKFVLEHRKDSDVLLVRFLKPTWTIPKGDEKQVVLQFGYNQPWKVATVGSGNELRGALPLRDVDAFLSGFQKAGRIDVTFVGGTETPWQIATGGGGFVEADFRKCVQMSIPKQSKSPTQP
jgi:hypothetical protein